MRILACLGFFLIAAPVLAEEWPLQVAAEIAERQAYCKQQGDKAEIDETFLRRVDLDGDGRDDFIMDDSGFQCAEGAPPYCGSGGCTLQVFMGRADGARRVFSMLAQSFTLNGKVLEVSQGKNYAKTVVRFENGCAIRAGGKRSC